jgi:uncharacterized protein
VLRTGDYDTARRLTADRIAEQTATLPPSQRPGPEQARLQAAAMNTPVFREFITYDPAPALSALTVPTLAFYGQLDVQVPPDQSVPALTALLAGRPDLTVRTLAGLNHLMQPATTGSPAEYGSIETTIAPAALDLVTTWLTERFG